MADREAVRYKRSKAQESMGQKEKLQKRLNSQASFARWRTNKPNKSITLLSGSKVE